MEIIIAHWWVVKLLIALFFGFSIFKIVETKFKSKFWILIYVIMTILVLFIPFNIGVTQNQNTKDYSMVNLRKNVPGKVKDNSSIKSTKLRGVKEKDLR